MSLTQLGSKLAHRVREGFILSLEVAKIDLLTAKNSRSLSSALSPLLKQRAPAKRLMDAAIQWALFSCPKTRTSEH